MTITLDPNISKSLTDGMRSSDAIELPFPAPFLWVLNGQAAYKQQGGALYFGGWACKAEQMNEVLAQTKADLPAGFAVSTISTKDGGEFEAYTTRNVLVAPIAKRESWITRDGNRAPHYSEGSRQHVQVLCYMAERTKDGKIHPVGEAVLTAKGFQAIKLNKAFQTWDKATAQSRMKIAPGVPAWCFYLSVGTFGKDRLIENVGKTAQSPITPVSCYVPEKISDELIESLFVGEAVAAIMAQRKEEASEWLAAWKAPAEEVTTNGSGYAENVQPPDNSYEDIPF